MRRARPLTLAFVVLLFAAATAAQAQPCEESDAETLNAAEPAGANPAAIVAAPDQADVVTTIGGGRLVGTVLAMESDGRLRLKGPSFKGEVVVAADSVASVTLRPAAASAGTTEVTLSGGDRLLGSLAAVTPEVVILDGPAGRLQIPRRQVRTVNLVPVADVLLTSDFNSGKLGPGQAAGWRRCRSSAANWSARLHVAAVVRSGPNSTSTGPSRSKPKRRNLPAACRKA